MFCFHILSLPKAIATSSNPLFAHRLVVHSSRCRHRYSPMAFIPTGMLVGATKGQVCAWHCKMFEVVFFKNIYLVILFFSS